MISSAASKAMRVAKAAAFYAVVLGVLAALVLVAGTKAEAAFPGKNGKIAFTSWRDGNPEIYRMSATGTSQTRLTKNIAFDGQPSYSPDGRKMVFTSDRDGNPEVYAINADGTGVKRLTNNTVFDGAPVYSPDGKHIAFVSGRAGLFEIYRMGADGDSPLRLTYVSDNLAPSWQPLP